MRDDQMAYPPAGRTASMARGISSRVYAMARPRRPTLERDLVRKAAGGGGSAAARAARLAARVALATIAAVDELEEETVLSLLREFSNDPVMRLARDPEIDTARLIRNERAKQSEARGGRRLAEREWPAEDARTAAAVSVLLTRRYRSFLAGHD